MLNKFFNHVKNFLYLFSVFMLGCSIIITIYLYLDLFNLNNKVIKVLVTSLVSLFTSCVIYFKKKRKDFIFKIFYLFLIAVAILFFCLFLLKQSGFLVKINSINTFREYVSSFESLAVIVFILFQFLQVVILPIPGFITVGAGVLLFGPLLSAIYSCIGIILGSIVAFFFGRLFGVKGVTRIVGKDNLEKGLKFIEGNDKLLFSFMFLFPFFPDDLLCFLAGISKITTKFFIFMTIITRTLSIFVSCFSFSNDLLPYNTWWGILVWLAFFVVAFYVSTKILKIKKIN